MNSLPQNTSGGAISAVGADTNITIKQCLFKENAATYGGGAIDIFGSRSLLLKNSTFVRNTVTTLKGYGYGGAIDLLRTSDITVEQCLFQENTATFRGGAAYIQKSQTLFESCIFERNKVNSLNQDNRGGAISAAGADTNITIKQCLFKENKATGPGGAIYVELSRSLFLRSSTFVRNTVKNLTGYAAGGAITLVRNSDLIVQQCLFKENTATYSGGAISMQETQGSFENCTFVGNAAQYLQRTTVGGAISFLNGSSYLIKRCLFKKNNATFYGGACYIQRSQGSFENCTFEGKV